MLWPHMSPTSNKIAPQDITALLLGWRQGSPDDEEKLLRAVYQELHRIAGLYLANERAGHTLQATALVHEAYLRLVDQERVSWQSRAHFFGVAANMMRRILVDHARRRRAEKRGSELVRVALDEARDLPVEPEVDLIALDDALVELAELDAQHSRLVELRYFAGLTIRETAEVLDISPATIKREWSLARAWLYRHMTKS